MAGRDGVGERLLGLVVLRQGRDHPPCLVALGAGLHKRRLGVVALLPGAVSRCSPP